MTTPSIRVIAASGAALLVAGGALLAAPAAQAAPGDSIGPINPVTQPLGSHAANSGFLIFIENDVQLNLDESEGTLALGGDLSFSGGYNIYGGAPTYTVPGDAFPVALHVGGAVDWAASAPIVLRVLQGGFTKIGSPGTYLARDSDDNAASSNYRIFAPGTASFDATPRIEGVVNQPPASVGQLGGSDLIDIPAAFALYRTTAAQLGTCTPTITLADRDSGAPLTSPIAPGSNGSLTLTPGQTNVLDLTTTDLANVAEITFVTPPTQTMPLLINVTGASFTGGIPNLAGISGAQAPYILWNFVDATTITVTGGDSLEGTIYAPNADLEWRITQNIEGNVIASSFVHGVSLLTGGLREIHDMPFDAQLSCIEEGTITPGPDPEPTVDPEPVPDPDPSLDPVPEPDDELAASGSSTTAEPALLAGTALGAGGALLLFLSRRAARRRTP